MDSEGTDGGGRWMTKAEFAALSGIMVASADRLIRRHHWRKERGNDGRARVLVPPPWCNPRAGNTTDTRTPAADDPTGDPTDSPPGNSTDTTAGPKDIDRVISGLERALTALREQLDRERTRADAAEGRADRAESRVHAIEAELAAARATADALRADLAERAAWGWWRRLRGK
jgi:hypothetical protein